MKKTATKSLTLLLFVSLITLLVAYKSAYFASERPKAENTASDKKDLEKTDSVVQEITFDSDSQKTLGIDSSNYKKNTLAHSKDVEIQKLAPTNDTVTKVKLDDSTELAIDSSLMEELSDRLIFSSKSSTILSSEEVKYDWGKVLFKDSNSSKKSP